MHNIAGHLYPYCDTENPELCNRNIHLKPSRRNDSIISSITASWPHRFSICICPSERAYFNYLEYSNNVWHVYNKWSRRVESRSSGGKTLSNPQVSVLIPRDTSNGTERVCQRHGTNKNSHPPALVQKTSCNQLLFYCVRSKWGFDISYLKLRNLDVVAIDFLATVDRASIMPKIHRWSVMI